MLKDADFVAFRYSRAVTPNVMIICVCVCMCTLKYTHTHTHTRVQGPIGALGKALFFEEQAGKPKLALCWMVVFQAKWAEASPTWAPSSGEPSTALSRERGYPEWASSSQFH